MRKLTIGGDLYSAGAELPDEGLIMAYVDDELDEEGRRYVEDLLARSAEAREIAELMRSSSALLKSAFLDDPDCDTAGGYPNHDSTGKSRRSAHPPSIKRSPLPPDDGSECYAYPRAAKGLRTGKGKPLPQSLLSSLIRIFY